MRLLFLLFACLFCIYAEPLRIVQIVPFGEGNLRIAFNRAISLNDIKQNNISTKKSTLTLKATLKTGNKRYTYPNKMQIHITQKEKNTIRITISSPTKLNYDLRFSNKYLYIETKTKKTTSSKNKKPPNFIQPPSPKKRIVIDAGHGGKDCGAIGVLKICEKVITLNVAKILEQELKKRGYVVYMTRNKDHYLGLRERTNFANAKNADLFISIHANSVPKRSEKTANGIETYFLSTARSERARRVAEKENKDNIEVMNFFSKQTFLNSINTHRLIASNKLAIDIQSEILKKLKTNYSLVVDGGVREGPFWVLAGALMPSVLIEIGYISHPQEGRRINHRDYQILLSNGIANGIDEYFKKNP